MYIYILKTTSIYLPYIRRVLIVIFMALSVSKEVMVLLDVLCIMYSAFLQASHDHWGRYASLLPLYFNHSCVANTNI
jgi:hypothetical protein